MIFICIFRRGPAESLEEYTSSLKLARFYSNSGFVGFNNELLADAIVRIDFRNSSSSWTNLISIAHACDSRAEGVKEDDCLFV